MISALFSAFWRSFSSFAAWMAAFLDFSPACHSTSFFSAFTTLNLLPLKSRQASSLSVAVVLAAPRSNDPNPPFPPLLNLISFSVLSKYRSCSVSVLRNQSWSDLSVKVTKWGRKSKAALHLKLIHVPIIVTMSPLAKTCSIMVWF